MTDLVRASDAEREQVAERLRRAHAEGRIDTAELEERVQRCYAAKTGSELDRLVADLPGPNRPGGRRGRRPGSGLAISPITVLVLLVAVLAFSSHGRFPLPLLAILFFVFLRFGHRAHWHR